MEAVFVLRPEPRGGGGDPSSLNANHSPPTNCWPEGAWGGGRGGGLWRGGSGTGNWGGVLDELGGGGLREGQLGGAAGGAI